MLARTGSERCCWSPLTIAHAVSVSAKPQSQGLAVFGRGRQKMRDVSIRTLVLELVDGKGASHIRELHLEVLERRPGTP
jgi:hypothetical protein